MSRKVFVNEECCVGCGTCAELCPEVFKLDEISEKSRVIRPESDNIKCIEEAISACPNECISWKEG